MAYDEIADLILELTFTYIFWALGPRCFLRAMMVPPLDTPLCGAEQVRKLNEREWGMKKYGGAEREGR